GERSNDLPRVVDALCARASREAGSGCRRIVEGADGVDCHDVLHSRRSGGSFSPNVERNIYCQPPSRTLRRGIVALVTAELLAGPAAIDATLPGTCASRTGHGGFVGTEHPTNILVREYRGRCAGETERGTQHRAVVLAKEAGFGHR